MSESNQSETPEAVTPSRHDRLRPLEMVGFSGALAVFAGLVVMFVTRGWDSAQGWGLGGIFAASAFILSLLTIALVGLGGAQSEEDIEARKDLQSPDRGSYH